MSGLESVVRGIWCIRFVLRMIWQVCYLYTFCWYVSYQVYQFCHETFIDLFEGCRHHFKGNVHVVHASSQILQTYFLGVVTVVNFDAARVNYHVSPFLKELSVSWHEPFTEHIQFRNKHGITKDVHSQPKHPHFQPGNEWRTDSCSPGYPVQILFPLTKIVLFCYILQPSLAM